MSCFREDVYAVYADGELPPDEVRAVEMHLVGCQACRALVLALREEAELLTDVLAEREHASFVPTAPRAAARGLALGGLPALILVTLGAGVVRWLAETGLPSSVAWLNPLNAVGVYEMGLDLIFTLRDRLPGLIEFAVAGAATASFAALLTFAVGVLLRGRANTVSLALSLGVLLAAPPPADAHFGLHDQEDFVLAKGEVHEGTLVASGHSVSVDGVVTGDLVVFARRLSVRGEVQGNAFAIGHDVEIEGRVAGSLHTAAKETELSGSVGGNAYALGRRFRLAEGARVAGDLSTLARDASLDGAVGRDFFAMGRRVEVRGSVGRDLAARVARAALLDGARIGRNVDARLHRSDEIERAPGAVVVGETHVEREVRHHAPGLRNFLDAGFYLWLAIHVGAAFLMGMLLHAVFPQIFGVSLETPGAFYRALGVGFLTLLATPVAVVAVALTLVGLPVALLGAALYLAGLYAGGIVVAALVGAALTGRRSEATAGFGLTLLVGLLVLHVLMSLPFVGIPIRVLAVMAGVGLLVDRARAMRSRQAAAF